MRPEACGLPTPQRRDRIRISDLPSGKLHVVIFGPGEGEAALLLLPDGSVGIVDGCCEPTDPTTGAGDPVRELLSEIPDPRIRFVCLTHPHGDHYAGLGRLIRAYENQVEAIWSTSLSTGKYQNALLEVNELLFDKVCPDPLSKRNGLPLFIEGVVRALDSKSRCVDTLLGFRPLIEETSATANLRIYSCGPAAHDMRIAELRLSDYYQCLLNENLPPAELDPNLTSGALLVRWGDAGVLLTGDLLSGSQETRSGWNHSSSWVCQHPIQVVNAAHHASEGAHHDGIWHDRQPKLVIVTPFNKAVGDQPPRPEQIDRLAQSACVLITSPPDWVDANATDRPVPMKGWAAPQPPMKGRARTSVLSHTPKPSYNDMYNAVAVSLSADGRVDQILLGGKADIYEPTPSGKL